jgi:hypothetical protein
MKFLAALVAVLLLLLLVIGGALLAMRRETPRVFTLSNGSVITYTGATFGTNHYAPGSSRWVRMLPRVVQTWLGRGPAGSAYSTPAPSGLLWFERSGPALNSGNFLCEIVQEDGFVVAWGHNGWTGNKEMARGAIPRRERTLRVRVRERSWAQSTNWVLGEFTIPNPAPLSSARWKAGALPQTAADGGFEAVLESLTSGRTASWSDGPGTILAARIREQGAASTNWQIERVIAMDATSNRIEQTSWSTSGEKGLQKIRFSPALWPSEAYQVRVEFSRRPEGPFAPEETWTVRDIAVPTNGGFTTVGMETNLNGIKVRCEGLNAKGGRPPWPNHYSGEAALSFVLSPAPKGLRFKVLSITDERGRRISESGRGYSDTAHSIGLPLSNDVRRVNVTVAMPKSRFLEFLAQPVHTNELRW